MAIRHAYTSGSVAWIFVFFFNLYFFHAQSRLLILTSSKKKKKPSYGFANYYFYNRYPPVCFCVHAEFKNRVSCMCAAAAPVALTTSAIATAAAAALEDVPATPPGTFLHFLLDPLALNYRTCQNVKNLSVYACAERTIFCTILPYHRIATATGAQRTGVWRNAHAVHVDLMSTTMGDPKGVHKNKIKKK